jgi:hypothetical protein
MAIVLLAAYPTNVQSKHARKFLRQRLTVDGAGSGLDADTIHGMTVDHLLSSEEPGPQYLSQDRKIPRTPQGFDSTCFYGRAAGG